MTSKTKTKVQPRLGNGIYHKEFREGVIKNRHDFESSLARWLESFVSRSRVAPLIHGAKDDIEKIVRHVSNAPVTLNLNETREVHIHFELIQDDIGRWTVQGVYFSEISRPTWSAARS
jgi:hypothetical protein